MHDGWGGVDLVYMKKRYISGVLSLQVMNAIQEAIAPVGQPFVTTAPTVSAVSRLHRSVGQSGELPSMEFQMRNKTFISSMVLSVACVSAANAAVTPGFVSIDDFQIASTANGSATWNDVFTDDFDAYGAAEERMTYGAGRKANASTMGNAYGSVVVASNSGVMTMSYGGVAGTSNGAFNANNVATWGFGYFVDQAPVQTAQAAFASTTGFNWSTGTAFSFDIASYASSGPVNSPLLQMVATDNDGNTFYTQVALVNGHVNVNFSAFTGINFSNLYYIGFQLDNTNTAGSPSGGGVPSASLQISNFGYVPAPGAVALLGAAGLVGARRRRA